MLVFLACLWIFFFARVRSFLSFFLLNKIKRILHRSQIADRMSHRTYATALAPEGPCYSDNASSAHDAGYHLALALRGVEAFIAEEFDIEDDDAALEALAAEMQAQADLPDPEP